MAGLYLVVHPSGKKSWAIRYRRRSDKKQCRLTLGPLYVANGDATPREAPTIGGPLTLHEARKLAGDKLHQARLGEDPAADRKKERAAARNPQSNLFADVALRFIEEEAKKEAVRSWPEVARLLGLKVGDRGTLSIAPGGIADRWSAVPVAQVSKADVLDRVAALKKAGLSTSANRTFAALRRLFNWCEGLDLVQRSPCRGLPMPAGENPRDRTLSHDEIRLLWRACEEIGDPFGPMIKLLLVTAQRRDEVAGMLRAELSLEDKPPSWLIPASRAKNGRAQYVPLAPMALGLIDSMPRIGRAGYVFTTTGNDPVSGYSRAKGRIDAVMLRLSKERDPNAAIEAWTIHDLRRTAATQLQKLGVRIEVTEAILNHKSGTIRGVAAIYQRHDFAAEKQAALFAWADKIAEIVA